MPDQIDFSRERALLSQGLGPVAGIDEAGRGPLAGPVSAAAVILDPANLPAGLDDSKKLSAAARDALYEAVMESALAVGVALVPAQTIDRINIRQATLLCMRRAVQALALAPGYVLVDGKDLPPGLSCPGEALVDGDALSLSIAAASIVAKVTRDRLMVRLGAQMPAYAFEVHKGYGTPVHRAAIARHGVSPYHRMSFGSCKNGTV